MHDASVLPLTNGALDRCEFYYSSCPELLPNKDLKVEGKNYCQMINVEPKLKLIADYSRS